MVSDSSPMTRRRARLSACSCKILNPRSNGMPASTRVASWRVKTVRVLGLIPLPQAGKDRFQVLGSAREAGSGWSRARAAWACRQHLCGKQTHFLDSPQGFRLVGDIERAARFDALRINRHVRVVGHKQLRVSVLTVPFRHTAHAVCFDRADREGSRATEGTPCGQVKVVSNLGILALSSEIASWALKAFRSGRLQGHHFRLGAFVLFRQPRRRRRRGIERRTGW